MGLISREGSGTWHKGRVGLERSLSWSEVEETAHRPERCVGVWKRRAEATWMQGIDSVECEALTQFECVQASLDSTAASIVG